MATRMHARVAVIQLLYAKELGNEKILEQAQAFFDERKIRNKQQQFALSLLHGVCQYEYIIVQVMNVFLKTWDIDRLGVIEKNILKLGIYELLETDTEEAIVINEAIELTKIFNITDAFRLINGVLDAVAKTSADKIADLIQSYKHNIPMQSIGINTQQVTQSRTQDTSLNAIVVNKQSQQTHAGDSENKKLKLYEQKSNSKIRKKSKLNKPSNKKPRKSPKTSSIKTTQYNDKVNT